MNPVLLLSFVGSWAVSCLTSMGSAMQLLVERYIRNGRRVLRKHPPPKLHDGAPREPCIEDGTLRRGPCRLLCQFPEAPM